MGVIDRAILQDEISQALNALFRNGQVPYIKTSNVLTFDGDTTDKEGLGPFCKVTDRVIDVGEVDSVLSIIAGQKRVISKEEFTIEEQGGTTLVVAGATQLFAVFTEDVPAQNVTKGTYVYAEGKNFYTAEIRGVKTETIHPIDLKFIPGAVLPVVELSGETLMALIEANGADVTLPEKNQSELNNALAQRMPIVVMAGDSSIVVALEGVAYSMTASGMTLRLFLSDTGWKGNWGV